MRRPKDVYKRQGVNKGGAESGQAPENRARDNKRLAAKPVAQPAAGRRSKHVEEKQSRGEPAHHLVGGVELTLDKGLRAVKNVAIEIVEQVERNEQQDRAQCWAFVGTHLS